MKATQRDVAKTIEYLGGTVERYKSYDGTWTVRGEFKTEAGHTVYLTYHHNKATVSLKPKGEFRTHDFPPGVLDDYIEQLEKIKRLEKILNGEKEKKDVG